MPWAESPLRVGTRSLSISTCFEECARTIAARLATTWSAKHFTRCKNTDELDAALDILGQQNADFVKIYLEHSSVRGGVLIRSTWAERFGPKQYGLAPELAAEAVSRAHARGWRVSAHVDTAADFRTAVEIGVDEINHLPGFVWAEGLTSDAYRLSQADAERAASAGTVVVTTIGIALRLYPNDPDGLQAVQALQRENLQRLHAAGVRIAIGSDSPPDTSREEVAVLRKIGAFDDETLLRLWIETARTTIFPKRRLGCLDVGCEASFLVLRQNPIQDFGALDAIELAIKEGVSVGKRPETE